MTIGMRKNPVNEQNFRKTWKLRDDLKDSALWINAFEYLATHLLSEEEWDFAETMIVAEREPIDYEQLLKKYIGHVGDCEGCSFVQSINKGFSEEEHLELVKLDQEVQDEFIEQLSKIT